MRSSEFYFIIISGKTHDHNFKKNSQNKHLLCTDIKDIQNLQEKAIYEKKETKKKMKMITYCSNISSDISQLLQKKRNSNWMNLSNG